MKVEAYNVLTGEVLHRPRVLNIYVQTYFRAMRASTPALLGGRDPSLCRIYVGFSLHNWHQFL